MQIAIALDLLPFQQKLKDHATGFCSMLAPPEHFVLLVYQAESSYTPVELPVVI